MLIGCIPLASKRVHNCHGDAALKLNVSTADTKCKWAAAYGVSWAVPGGMYRGEPPPEYWSRAWRPMPAPTSVLMERGASSPEEKMGATTLDDAGARLVVRLARVALGIDEGDDESGGDEGDDGRLVVGGGGAPPSAETELEDEGDAPLVARPVVDDSDADPSGCGCGLIPVDEDELNLAFVENKDPFLPADDKGAPAEGSLSASDDKGTAIVPGARVEPDGDDDAALDAALDVALTHRAPERVWGVESDATFKALPAFVPMRDRKTAPRGAPANPRRANYVFGDGTAGSGCERATPRRVRAAARVCHPGAASSRRTDERRRPSSKPPNPPPPPPPPPLPGRASLLR